ncbi:MAG: hypothetical protein GYB35_03945 [Algicola sp.]|nr:hypothetical protein [Algicola sp.]
MKYFKIITLATFMLAFLNGFSQKPLNNSENNNKNINFKKYSTNKGEVISLTSSTSNSPESSNLINRASSSSAGTTRGEFSVSPSGGARYNIPLTLPPGIKEMVPNVSISYNSQSSNGLAGWGWNITGISTISRLPSSQFHDGEIDGVNFNSKDRFALDGQRLILKSGTGTYGADNSEYQTENYSNLKILAIGTSTYGSSYGPLYFKVISPDGTISWYGQSGNSRGKLEWALNMSKDPQGNYIEYRYQNSNGLLRISKIKYGARVYTSNPPNEISFEYGLRARPRVSYINDQTFIRTNILKNVIIKGGGQQFRKYSLNHDVPTSLGYEKLKSITEFNENNESFAPIIFDYGSTNDGFNKIPSPHSITPGIDFITSRMRSGDVDADGNLDLILFDNTDRTKINIITEMFDANNQTDTYNINFQDEFNEVFTSNILSSNNSVMQQQGITVVSEEAPGTNSTVTFSTFSLSSTTGATFEYDKAYNFPIGDVEELECGQPHTGSNDYRIISKEYINGDFNGDGLTDVIVIPKKYYKRVCETYYNYTEDTEECDCGTEYVNLGNSPVYFIDLNRNITNDTAINLGSLTSRISSDDDRVFGADFDGDGKTDLIHFRDGSVRIYTINSSNQLNEIAYLPNSHIDLEKPILLGDYNGDGKMDFLIPQANNDSNWQFYMSKGSSIFTYGKDLGFNYEKTHLFVGTSYTFGIQMLNPLHEFHYIAQDINGDGKTDIIKHQVHTPLDSNSTVAENIQTYANIQNSTSSSPSFSLTENYTETNNGTKKYGIPIFLEASGSNGNLEYAYIDGDVVTAYEFSKDHKIDMTLEKITNDQLITDIYYETLDDPDDVSVYTPDIIEQYPNININIAPSFKLVKEVNNTASGIVQRQLFLYSGAVSNIEGLGFLGFKTVRKTNWFGNDVSQLWNVSKFDMSNRGAIDEQWLSTLNSTSPTGYATKMNYSYLTNITSSKVYINVPSQIIHDDALQGFVTTKTYSYDNYYNPLSYTSVFPGGSKTVTYQYNNNLVPTNNTYHVGRLSNKIETSVLGSNSFTTESQFTYLNGLVSQLKNRGNGTSWLTQDFLYDLYGNVTSKTISGTGVVSRTELYAYDSSGRFLEESTNIEGQVTYFNYNVNNGNLLSTTDEYGLTTSFNYDGWNRLLKETDYLGNETNYEYNKEFLSGNGWCYTKLTDYDEGQDEKVYYNPYGWMVQIKTLNINDKWIQKSFEYDIIGKKFRESEPYFSTSSASQWNQYFYDSYGRPISRQLYTGKTINTTYNGLVTTTNDGTKTVVTTKIASGNIASVQDPGGTVTYTYHGNGAMKSANYGSHTVNVTIDDWGRKQNLIDPSSGSYTFNYNILGEIIEEISPKGVTTYNYDDYGKLISKAIVGDETNLTSSYVYDSNSKLLSSITSSDVFNNKSYEYFYTYDNSSRIQEIRENTDVAKFSKTLTYDSFGRIENSTYSSYSITSGNSSTVKIKNLYDASGILTEIRDFDSNSLKWKLTSANARGQSLSTTLGNGFMKTRQYDQYGYLVKIYDRKLTLTGPFDPPVPPVVALEMDYSFDAQRGILNSRKNYAFNNWDESFTHDSLDRLTQINGPAAQSNSYDATGRITNNSLLGDYNYQAGNTYRLDNIELNTNGENYALQNELQEVKYNAFKKPTSISEENHGKVDFLYGPMKNRTQAFYGGTDANINNRKYHKYYSSIIPSEIIENQADASTKIIIYLGGDAYKAPLVHIKTNNFPLGDINDYHYLHRDYLGSILSISDENLNILEERQFGAWGKVDNYSSSTGSTTFTHDSLLGRGFTGHEHFFEIGLIHMNGRMYDSNLGRFLSPDNYIQDPYNTQSYNRYGYVWNNPLVLNDPNGEFWMIALGAIFGGYLGASMHQGSFDPSDWGKDWWKGAIVGAIVGAYAANVLATKAATGTFLAGGGISQGTIFSKALIATGKAMIKSYTKAIFDFDLEKGFTFNFKLDKDRMNLMLFSGAMAAVNNLIGQGKELLYKAGKDGAAATGLLAKKEWIGKLTRNLLDNSIGGIVNNIAKNDKGVFEDLTFFKFAGGLIKLGEGEKILNIKNIQSHATGWLLYGLASDLGVGKVPKFDLFSLNFNYKANAKFLQEKMESWWGAKPITEKIILGGVVSGMLGAVSTYGVNAEF